MLDRFLDKTEFESYEDFMENFHVNVPENFNFAYDVVDTWAEGNLTNQPYCGPTTKGRRFNSPLPT